MPGLQQRRQRPYSIRTRIKTPSRANIDAGSSVRDHIPLEQGLRHREHAPITGEPCKGQRPYSIRTRIKTGAQVSVKKNNPRSETIFH